MFSNLLEAYEAVCTCEKCEYAKTRRHTVFGEGNLHSKIMFIGEGPGKVEDETGRPFVGPAGQLLDKMLAAIDLKREDVYICNVVKCRPPHNAVPKPECVGQCMDYLRMQVRAIAPEIIVCLGKTAVTHVLKETGAMISIHGRIYEKGRFRIIPTYHPSALLRDESKKRLAWEDFKVIRGLLQNDA